MAKRKPNIGLSVYRKISKQFTKFNNGLPKESRLPIKIRREIIKNEIFPSYKGKHLRDVKVDALRELFNYYLQLIPPQPPEPPTIPDESNLLYIDPSDYADVEYYLLDNLFAIVLPPLVACKVTAGDEGETKIFSTSTYSYINTGVREIVENVRKIARSKSGLTFTGIVQVKPGYSDNRRAESYFLNMVLNHGSLVRMQEKEAIEFEELPQEEVKKREVQKKNKEKIKEKIAEADKKKKAEIKAKKDAEKNDKKKELAKKDKEDKATDQPAKKESTSDLKLKLQLIKEYKELLNEGLITKADFRKLIMSMGNSNQPTTPTASKPKKKK